MHIDIQFVYNTKGISRCEEHGAKGGAPVFIYSTLHVFIIFVLSRFMAVNSLIEPVIHNFCWLWWDLAVGSTKIKKKKFLPSGLIINSRAVCVVKERSGTPVWILSADNLKLMSVVAFFLPWRSAPVTWLGQTEMETRCLLGKEPALPWDRKTKTLSVNFTSQ